MTLLTVRTGLCAISAMLLAACASTPPHSPPRSATTAPVVAADAAARRFNLQGGTSAGPIGPIEFAVDGGLAVGAVRADALLSSTLSVGEADGALHYRLSHAIQPGDLLAGDEIPATAATRMPTPSRYGGQQLRQQLRMKLPSVGGAPVSLGLTSESRSTWAASGSHESLRELAELRWSPSWASLNVQWAGPTTQQLDPVLALDCELSSVVRLPVRQPGGGNAHTLDLSGRDCRILAAPLHYADLGIRTWGASYTWRQPGVENRLGLSVIEPVWRAATGQADVEPGYELQLNHRRTRNQLSANAQLAARQANARAGATPQAPSGTLLSSSAGVTWRLPDVSISANWAYGIDSLWFMPDIGQHRNRLGLALDLSEWARTNLPGVPSPRLGVNWNWWEMRARNDFVSSDAAINVSMSTFW